MATLLSGSFTSATTSAASVKVPVGEVWAAIYASSGVGTVKIQKSYDGGTTYVDVSLDTTGSPASYSISNSSIDVVLLNLEQSAVYRFNCTAYTSGTIFYVMGSPR